MKRKKFLILGSIFAGAALVGGTFAAWAVTDNAAAKSLKISTEKIQTDTSTQYVTLEWGESTSLADVANLETGHMRLGGVVGLKATYSGSNSYNGLLSASLTQASKTGAKLLDYLTVYAYVNGTGEGNQVVFDNTTKEVSALPSTSSLKYLELNSTNTSGQKVVPMTNGTDVDVYFVVSLSSDATEQLTNIKNDVVNLEINWDHYTTGQTVLEDGVTVYYRPSSGTLADGEKVYCYAWADKTANGDFPGAEMTSEGNGLYSYRISTDANTGFEHFILSHGTVSNTGVVNVTKFTVKDSNPAVTEFNVEDLVESGEGVNIFFNYDGTRGAKPEATAGLNHLYYLVGSFNDWKCVDSETPADSYGLSQAASGEDDNHDPLYEITGVALHSGDLLKVRNNSNEATEVWYSNVSTWTGCGYTLDNEGNIVVGADGTYTITLYRTSAYNNHVILSRTGD